MKLSLRKRVFFVLVVASGAFLGRTIGAAVYPMAAFVFFVPVVFFLCPSRRLAWCFIFTYYAVASRDVPAGSAVFFGAGAPIWTGYLLWFSANLVLSAFWVAVWVSPRSGSFFSYFLRLMVLFMVLTVPPVGVFSWASPLVSCGYLFPGSGWTGILAFFLLTSGGIAVMRSAYYPVKVVVICLLLGPFMIALLTPPSRMASPVDWATIDTNYGKAASGSIRFTDAFIRSTNMIPLILEQERKYILVPETIAGLWTPAARTLWEPVAEELKERVQTLVLGTEILDEKGKYDNCMLFLGADDSALYKQRIPVPFSMWRPFGGAGTANAYWWETGRITLADGREAAALICYEQFLVWPILRSMATTRKTDLLLCSANQWWSRDTCIPEIEQQYARSWALLFNLEFVSARNM